MQGNTDRSLDAGAIQPEPDPQHPFADGYGLMLAHAEPPEGQQEAAKAPRRQARENGEVSHHGPERQEDQVVRQNVESQSRDQHRSRHGHHIESLLPKPLLLVDPEAIGSQGDVRKV